MNKLGVFGGTFNPIHNGHINSLMTVKDSLSLDEIRVIPASQNPLRISVQGPTPEQRLNLVKKGLEDEVSAQLVVDDVEVLRGGMSYTIDTLKGLSGEKGESDLHLIIGLDQFENFDRWFDYQGILEISNLVVTSRPGNHFPESVQDFPDGISAMVESFSGDTVELKTGKKIYFIQLDDIDISATELRKKIRNGESIEGYVPSKALDYILSEHLYESLDKNINDYRMLTEFCAQTLDGKSAINITGFDLTSFDYPAEYTIVASGTSTRHTKSLAERLTREVKTAYGVFPQNVEGQKEGRWVVLDYGSLMIHLFYDYVRTEYRLEDLWAEGERLNFNLKSLEN